MTEIALLVKTEGKCNMTSDFSVTACTVYFFLTLTFFYDMFLKLVFQVSTVLNGVNCLLQKSSHVHSLQKCHNQLLSHVFTSLGM